MKFNNWQKCENCNEPIPPLSEVDFHVSQEHTSLCMFCAEQPDYAQLIREIDENPNIEHQVNEGELPF